MGHVREMEGYPVLDGASYLASGQGLGAIAENSAQAEVGDR